MAHHINTAVVLFGAHRWHRQEVIKFANEAGLQVVIAIQLGDDIDIPSYLETQIYDLVELPPDATQADIKQVAAELDRTFQQWFVFPLDDYVSYAAAGLSAFASAPCFSVKASDTSFHKDQLRELWNKLCEAKHGLPLQPVAYQLAAENACLTGLPTGEHFIVKPIAYAGSVGVFNVPAKQVNETIAKCQSILKEEAANPEMNGIAIVQEVLIETAIPRKAGLAGCAEFTAHFISLQGQHQLIGLAEKSIDPVSFIETSHIYPTPSFPKELQAVLEHAVKAMLSGLQVQNTISNWEFIITPHDKLALVEGQLRPSGDKVMELIENAHGANIYRLFFEALKDGKQASIPPAIRSSVICWPMPEKVVESIEWLKLPDTLQPLVKLFIDRPALLKSTNWPGPISWYHRHIAVMATGKNTKDAIAKCRKAVKGSKLKSGRSNVGLVDPFV